MIAINESNSEAIYNNVLAIGFSLAELSEIEFADELGETISKALYDILMDLKVENKELYRLLQIAPPGYGGAIYDGSN